jgi:hypothetical protein
LILVLRAGCADAATTNSTFGLGFVHGCLRNSTAQNRAVQSSGNLPFATILSTPATVPHGAKQAIAIPLPEPRAAEANPAYQYGTEVDCSEVHEGIASNRLFLYKYWRIVVLNDDRSQ